MSFSECHLQIWMISYLQHLRCRHLDHRGEEIIHRMVGDNFSYSISKAVKMVILILKGNLKWFKHESTIANAIVCKDKVTKTVHDSSVPP